MRITIITPSFNQAAYLEQTIDSVLSQGYEDLEYMIFDGGSTDGSVEIIRKYQKYLTYWESTPDRGQSHAINKGLERATGDVINWLNSDDYYEAGALSIVSELMSDERTLAVCGRSRLIDEHSGFIRLSQGTDIYRGNLAKTIALARIDQPETFFRSTATDSMGRLREDLHFTMDRLWWIQYLANFGLSGVKETSQILVNFRLHGTSKTSSSAEEFENEDLNLKAALSMVTCPHLSDLFNTLVKENKNIDLGIEMPSEACNYLALYAADYCYYQQKDFSLARQFLKCVEASVLPHEDIQWYRRLTIRLRMPDILLKSLLRWR